MGETMRRIRDWIIKKLGGSTAAEYERIGRVPLKATRIRFCGHFWPGAIIWRKRRPTMTPEKREAAIAWLNDEIRSLRLAPTINGCDMKSEWAEQLEIMETCLEAIKGCFVDTNKTSPLTLEQLREMDGQPYFHVGLQTDSLEPHWKILDPFVARCLEKEWAFGEKLATQRSAILRGTELAKTACRTNPTPENAVRLCNVLDGLDG